MTYREFSTKCAEITTVCCKYKEKKRGFKNLIILFPVFQLHMRSDTLNCPAPKLTGADGVTAWFPAYRQYYSDRPGSRRQTYAAVNIAHGATFTVPEVLYHCAICYDFTLHEISPLDHAVLQRVLHR